ncbi:MAG: branched-chain amino acid ABC transporter substrate-binding protein, partial [Burkholderiales bacterium]
MKLVQTVSGIAVTAALVSLSAPAYAQLVVKIGHVAPLTGAIAHLGKDNELGAKLAIEDLN